MIFKKPLHPFALVVSCLSIGRVEICGKFMLQSKIIFKRILGVDETCHGEKKMNKNSSNLIWILCIWTFQGL